MSQVELEVWQRLRPLALLFLIINGTSKLVRENLAFFAGAGAGVAFLDWLGLREALLGGGLMLLLVVVGAVIYHQRFRFRIEGDGIRVRKGLVEKKDLRIRFARIQNVELSQPFYFRPFGLVRFKLQTPGAVETEVELPGIDIDLANQLRDRIGQLGEVVQAPADEPEARNATEPVFAPGPGRLFSHGLASNQVWVLADQPAISPLFLDARDPAGGDRSGSAVVSGRRRVARRIVEYRRNCRCSASNPPALAHVGLVAIRRFLLGPARPAGAPPGWLFPSAGPAGERDRQPLSAPAWPGDP